MSDLTLQGGLEPEPGEALLAEFRANRAAYVRGHLVMAVVLGAVAGVALVLTGNPAPWAGPVGAVLAIGIRGWYLASEVLGMRWQLTDRRIVLPGGRAFRLADLVAVFQVAGGAGLASTAARTPLRHGPTALPAQGVRRLAH